MTTFTTPLDQVEALYAGYFGRAGDTAGTNYWISQLNSGASTLAQMAQSFAVQPEATTRYPYLASPTLGDPGAFVDQVYQNLFNHTADAAGKAYWVGQLNAAAGNPAAIGQFVLDVISGATGADNTTIVDKVGIAHAGTTSNTVAQSPATSPQNVANEIAKLTNEVVADGPTPQNAANELVKLTTGVPAGGPTPQTAFNSGTDFVVVTTGGMHVYDLTFPIYDASSQNYAASYFFTLYDITNAIESSDVVTLVGMVNMSATDYANISANHFSVNAA